MKTSEFLAKNALLFSDISQNEIATMLKCLEAAEFDYIKGRTILHRGEPFEKIGVVLSGTLLITREDEIGNLFVLTQVSRGQIFGMSFAGGFNTDIGISAGTDARVLIIKTERIFNPCCKNCQCHKKLLSNLFTCMAKKNVELTRKVYHISQRTLRRKVMSYLTEQMELCGRSTFDIPLDRQQMADYLACDRSALSAELARMKRAGIIDFQKNRFTVL
ncbi:MAG: Crp/Fnr family transcriptional regulator [Oscillospiraceae bacterium]|nr:Crp/Fnr family transcriptional regulator [Oscillospiraceae bacterium]